MATTDTEFIYNVDQKDNQLLVFGFINKTEKQLNCDKREKGSQCVTIPEVIIKLTLMYFQIKCHVFRIYESLRIFVNADRFISRLRQMHNDWIAKKYIHTKFGHYQLKESVSLNLPFEFQRKHLFDEYIVTVQFNLSLEDIMNDKNEFDQPRNPHLQINALIKHESMGRHLLSKTLRVRITKHFESSWLICKDKSFAMKQGKYVQHSSNYKFTQGWCDGTPTIETFMFFLKNQKQEQHAISLEIELMNVSRIQF